MLQTALATNPESALGIAKSLVASNPSVNVHSLAETFA